MREDSNNSEKSRSRYGCQKPSCKVPTLFVNEDAAVKGRYPAVLHSMIDARKQERKVGTRRLDLLRLMGIWVGEWILVRYITSRVIGNLGVG